MIYLVSFRAFRGPPTSQTFHSFSSVAGSNILYTIKTVSEPTIFWSFTKCWIISNTAKTVYSATYKHCSLKLNEPKKTEVLYPMPGDNLFPGAPVPVL